MQKEFITRFVLNDLKNKNSFTIANYPSGDRSKRDFNEPLS